MAGPPRRSAPAFAHHIRKSRSLPKYSPVKQTPLQNVRRSKRLRSLEEGCITSTYHPPSPRSEIRIPSTKRRRTQELDLDLTLEDQPAPKRLRSQRPTTPILSSPNTEVNWEEYFGTWPREAVNTTTIMRKSGSSKRSHSLPRSNSYGQSVRDGASPVAWTRQYEGKMLEARMIIDEHQTQAKISEASRDICDVILKADYDLPDSPAFREGKPLKVINLVRTRNEARISRDLTPYVCPSPELLHLDGCPGLDTISEALNAGWTECSTLYGPQPKPDMVLGISPSAFTSEEKEKLLMNHTSTCPNSFPEDMYFPFLICEVKSSNKSIQEAERQTMHSASIAVRAIIELYRKIPAVEEVHREVLVFSVAHDNITVRVYGHFALIEDDKITFFRHQLYVRDIAADLGPGLPAKPYKIIRGIYEHFFPKHLARIRAGLARLRSQDMDDNLQESVASLSSQGRFKRPSLPSSSQPDQEIEMLRAQVGNLLRELQKQKEDTQLQTQLQLAQQREDSRQQMERQMAQQREDLRQQMERQLAQQREDSRQQMEQQQAQYKEIVELLKSKR